ncbi:MAG: DNA-binding protein [Dethiosulfovibrio peptidovorans]|nr:MAG: DNA-binding protein [Dethiosulfovibrio peptidovorans]
MTKMELIDAVREKTGLKKSDAARAVSAVWDSLANALASGERVQLVGFGTFEIRQRAARIGRNPQNPDKTVAIPAKKVPVFRPGKGLKEKVNVTCKGKRCKKK